MHTKPMKDSAGTFSNWKKSSMWCSKCGGESSYRTWSSYCGGYIDYQYKCQSCKHVWWIDGIDS